MVIIEVCGYEDCFANWTKKSIVLSCEYKVLLSVTAKLNQEVNVEASCLNFGHLLSRGKKLSRQTHNMLILPLQGISLNT